MIKTLTLNLAESLASILGTPEKAEIYAYSLQMVLISVLNTIFLLLMALWLKILPVLLVFLMVFIPFRTFGGGVHLSTLPRCIIIGALLILGSAYGADKVYVQPHHLYLIFIFSLLLALWSTVKWVPASKNLVTNPQIIGMQKRNMLVSIMVWTGCVGFFIYLGHNKLALAMVVGAVVSSVLISPLGFNLMGVIDEVLNKLRREVV